MQGAVAKTAQRSEGTRLHGRYDRRLFVDNRMEENSYGNPNLAYAIRQVHASLGQHRISTTFAPICAIAASVAPSGIMTLPSCLIGWSRR